MVLCCGGNIIGITLVIIVMLFSFVWWLNAKLEDILKEVRKK